MARAAVSGRVCSVGANPATLSNLAAWYRADQGIHLEGATQKVEQWDDLSGNGRNLLQATTGLKPLLTTGNNAQPAVLFDGVDDYLQASFTLNSPQTVFLAGKAVGAGTAYDGVTFNRMFMSLSATSISIGDNSSVSGTMPFPGTGIYLVTTATFNGLFSSVRANGYTAANNGQLGSFTAGGITLGALGGTPSGFINLVCHELIVYSRALAEREIRNVERYLSNRYAIALMN